MFMVYYSSFIDIFIFAPNSLACQKEGAQGEEEEEAGDRKKGKTYKNSETSGADALSGPSWSRVSDTRNRRKHGRWCGVPLHRKGRGG